MEVEEVMGRAFRAFPNWETSKNLLTDAYNTHREGHWSYVHSDYSCGTCTQIKIRTEPPPWDPVLLLLTARVITLLPANTTGSFDLQLGYLRGPVIMLGQQA